MELNRVLPYSATTAVPRGQTARSRNVCQVRDLGSGAAVRDLESDPTPIKKKDTQVSWSRARTRWSTRSPRGEEKGHRRIEKMWGWGKLALFTHLFSSTRQSLSSPPFDPLELRKTSGVCPTTKKERSVVSALGQNARSVILLFVRCAFRTRGSDIDSAVLAHGRDSSYSVDVGMSRVRGQSGLPGPPP